MHSAEYLKFEATATVHKLFPKNEKVGMVTCFFCEASVTPVPKPDKDILGRENSRPKSLMNTDEKFSSLRKDIYKNSTADLFRDEKLSAFAIGSGTREDVCSHRLRSALCMRL